jgi:hypothetical protein
MNKGRSIPYNCQYKITKYSKSAFNALHCSVLQQKLWKWFKPVCLKVRTFTEENTYSINGEPVLAEHKA